MTESSPLPTYELNDTVAIIRLDDGKANVFSTAAVEALEAHLTQAETDAARALLLVGRPGKFSAGFDLAEMTSSEQSMRALVTAGARLWLRIYGLGIPTIAACTGHALAGGAVTLMACDLRLGADAPAKIGLNEVAIGMPLPQFVLNFARHRLAPTAFDAATLGAQIYDPSGAVAAGFLDRVVAPEDLEVEALAEARRLAQLLPGAYGPTKWRARGEMIEATLGGLVADMASISAPKP